MNAAGRDYRIIFRHFPALQLIHDKFIKEFWTLKQTEGIINLIQMYRGNSILRLRFFATRFTTRFFCCFSLFAASVYGSTITTISFDELNSSFSIDSTDSLVLNGFVLNTQYQALGVLFNDVLIADAVNQLDSSQTPPHSPNNTVVSLSDPILITFIAPVSTVSAYFNHFADLTLTAFDSASNPLGTVLGSGDNTSTLDTQNALLTFSAGAISSIAVTSSSSFTLDDLTFTVPDATSGPDVPEPGTLALVPVGLYLAFRYRKLRRSHS